MFLKIKVINLLISYYTPINLLIQFFENFFLRVVLETYTFLKGRQDNK